MKRHTKFWIGVAAIGLSLSLFACSGGKGNPMQTAGLDARTLVVSDMGDLTYYRAEARHEGDYSQDLQSVIFVHGTPGDAAAWRSYLEDVPPGFRYEAMDRPGFGASLPRTVYPALEDQAAAIEPLLPADGSKAILVGHSLGGPIIAKAAVLYPDRISGLVIVAGSLDPELEKIAWYQRMANVWPLSLMVPRSLKHANQEVMDLKPELETLKGELGALTLPVEIVHGTKDRLVPYANVAYMQDAMSEASLEVTTLEGRNHFIPWTEKAEIDRAILRLSERTRQSGAP